MRQDEKVILEKLTEEFSKFRQALQGDKAIGLVGLIEKQQDDEDYKRRNDDNYEELRNSLTRLSQHHEKLYKKITDIDERVGRLEEPMKVLHAIYNISKSIKTAILPLIAFLAILWAWFSKAGTWLADYFSNLIHYK